MPSDCYLELNYDNSKIELKPIENTNHNILSHMEHVEKFSDEYHNFLKFFIKNYDELERLGCKVRVYKTDGNININYYEYENFEPKTKRVYKIINTI